MVGLVLFAHNGLADTFLEALNIIVGPQEQIEVVGIDGTKSPEIVEKELNTAISRADTGEGVLILTDLFGGSPANFSLARMIPGKIEVVSGMNLAMLLKVVDLRSQGLVNPKVMARAVSRAGMDNIVLASDVLAKDTPENATVPDGGGDWQQ